MSRKSCSVQKRCKKFITWSELNKETTSVLFCNSRALARVKFRPTKIEFSKIPCVSTSMRLVKGICKNFYWIIQIYVDLKKQGSDCDQTLPAQPISIWNTQSRKKAHKPLRTLWISQKMCLPCLINSHNLVILTIE